MIPGRSYTSDSHFTLLCFIFLAGLAIALISSWYWITIIPFGILLFYLGWQQFPFIFYLLIISLPWSVEFSFSPSLGTDLPDETLMLFVSALFISNVFFKPSCLSTAWKHPLIMFLLFYFGWILVTVPFSTDWLLSLKFALAKSWYLLAFVFAPVLMFATKRSIQFAGLAFLVSMLCVVIIIIYRHALYGFTFANVNKAVNPFFRNHVNYSAMLV